MAREILFRRCRLEIEPSGVVRRYLFDPHGEVDQVNEIRPPQENERQAQAEAACYGYDSPRQWHIDWLIATAWLSDTLDTSAWPQHFLGDILHNRPCSAFGQWDEMSRFWFRRVRDGWPLVEHGQALNAATWTSFLASAIKADNDDNNRDQGRDTRNDEGDVGRAD